MSYILDALKKADAERERGAVPGLHTQAEPLPPDEHPTPAEGRSGTWLLIGLSVGAALAMGYALWGGGSGTSAEPASPSPQGRVPAPLPPITRTAPPETQPLPAPEAPKAAVLPKPPEPATRPSPKPQTPQESIKLPPPPRNASKQGGDPTQPRPLAVSELPEGIRRELPTLSIGGAMHSDTPSSRMLILSNGVFHEGEQPVPGLVLEEIRLKSAVFRYKGYRYSVNY